MPRQERSSVQNRSAAEDATGPGQSQTKTCPLDSIAPPRFARRFGYQPTSAICSSQNQGFSVSSESRFRFTKCMVAAAGSHHFNGGARLGRLALTDCELHGGSLDFNASGTYARVVAPTKNGLNRVPFSLGTGLDTTVTACLAAPAKGECWAGALSGGEVLNVGLPRSFGTRPCVTWGW